MTRPGLWIIACALLAALIFLPLRLAAGVIDIGESGISARQVSGTIWAGRLDQARLGPLDLGTVNVNLKAWPLLLGRARFAIERPAAGGTVPLSGQMEIGLGRRSIEQLSGTMPIIGVGTLPLESVTFSQFSAQFTDGQCRTANGRVQLMLAVRIAGIDLRNGLSGEARCDGRKLVIPLTGQSGMERLTMEISPDGRYQARLAIAAVDPTTSAALSAAGFSAATEGWTQTIRGQF